MIEDQQRLDRSNDAFWSELCGSSLARDVGITDSSPQSLARYDRAYLAFYPYLSGYVPDRELGARTVLEIGLGYGTLGQLLAGRARTYYGIDIARGPVAMMRHRLAAAGTGVRGFVAQASALDLPFPDGSVDHVFSIGCLHHTGDSARAVDEVHRILVPGGRAVVMLYHRHSFRRLLHAPVAYLRTGRRSSQGRRSLREFVRSLYDTNATGEAPPHTEFFSRGDVRRLFRRFSAVVIESRNFDRYTLFKGRLVLAREKFLGNLGRIVGLDLYVVATK